MNSKNTVLCFIIIFLFGVLDSGAQNKPQAKVHREKANTRDPKGSGWYFAKSTEGHFSVLLPLPFADFTMIAKDTLGKDIRTFLVGTKSDDGFQFAVTEFPRKNKAFDLRAIIKEFSPTDIKEEKTDTYSSISFKVQDTKIYARMRYIVTKTSLFLMTAEGPVSGKNDLDRIYKKFFDSFRLY